MCKSGNEKHVLAGPGEETGPRARSLSRNFCLNPNPDKKLCPLSCELSQSRTPPVPGEARSFNELL